MTLSVLTGYSESLLHWIWTGPRCKMFGVRLYIQPARCQVSQICWIYFSYPFGKKNTVNIWNLGPSRQNVDSMSHLKWANRVSLLLIHGLSNTALLPTDTRSHLARPTVARRSMNCIESAFTVVLFFFLLLLLMKKCCPSLIRLLS